MSNSCYVKFDGENLHPETMDVSDLATILDNLSKLINVIAPVDENIKFSLYNLEDNCIKLNFRCTIAAFAAFSTFISACSSKDFSLISYKATSPISKINLQIQKYNMRMEIGTDILSCPVNFSSENPIPMPNEKEFSEYQVYLYGKIMSVGGKEPNAHIAPTAGKSQIICEITQDMAIKLGSRLYQDIGIEGVVVEEKEGTPHRVKLIRLLDYCPSRGKKLLNEIKDLNFDDSFIYNSVTEFMNDIRGEVEDGE